MNKRLEDITINSFCYGLGLGIGSHNFVNGLQGAAFMFVINYIFYMISKR